MKINSQKTQLVATSANSLDIHVYDISNLFSHKIVDAFSDDVSYVDFSPDGTLIAAVSLEGEIKIWDAVTLDLHSELEKKHEGTVQNV